MLLVGWEEGHPTCINSLQCSLLSRGQPANPGSLGKRPLKWCMVYILYVCLCRAWKVGPESCQEAETADFCKFWSSLWVTALYIVIIGFCLINIHTLLLLWWHRQSEEWPSTDRSGRCHWRSCCYIDKAVMIMIIITYCSSSLNYICKLCCSTVICKIDDICCLNLKLFLSVNIMWNHVKHEQCVTNIAGSITVIAGCYAWLFLLYIQYPKTYFMHKTW